MLNNVRDQFMIFVDVEPVGVHFMILIDVD